MSNPPENGNDGQSVYQRVKNGQSDRPESLLVSRRGALKTIAGSTSVVGGLQAVAGPASAYDGESGNTVKPEEPDHDYTVKSEACGYHSDVTVQSCLNTQVWYGGYDSSRDKHKWITGIGSSNIAGANGTPHRNIEQGHLQIDWNKDKQSYRALDPEPAGYEPKVYGYQKASDSVQPNDFAAQIFYTTAGALSSAIAGPVGGAVWTGTGLLDSLAKNDEETWYNGSFNADFPFSYWTNQEGVEQAHYTWIYHVFLNTNEKLSVQVTDVVSGFDGNASSSVELTYTPEKFQYDINEKVDYSVVHSDSC